MLIRKQGKEVMDKALEEDYGLHVAKTEYKRVLLVCIFLGISFLFQLINLHYSSHLLGDNEHFFISNVLYSNLVILAFEAVMLFYIKSAVKKGLKLSRKFVWGYTYFEAIFPSFLIYGTCAWDESLRFLDSPIFLLYFIFIILSTLHLERGYSILTGLISGLSYMVVVYSLSINDDIEKANFHPILHYVKAAGLIGCGIIAGVVSAFIKNQFKNNLKITREKSKIQRIFGQQVSREVVQKLLGDNAHNDMITEEVEASILFMDIRNFSSYTENKNPKEIIELQNKIFNPLIEIIDKHHGIINQILGDGFMATFGTPIHSSNHCLDAFKAGCEIIEKMKQLEAENIIQELNIGIGLAVGTVVTGNIGNSIRKQFSVAGRTVILASRLEQLNKEFGSSFLISANVRRAIPETIPAEPLGKIAVKGFEEKIDVFKIR